MLLTCASVALLQEAHGLMMKYQISVAKEETEKVDTVRFTWQKLNTLAVSKFTTFSYSYPLSSSILLLLFVIVICCISVEWVTESLDKDSVFL